MMILRKVEEKDIKTLFDWANEASTRKQSLQSAVIPWRDHVEWFEGKISNPTENLLFIAQESDEVLGLIRFELKVSWTVSIVVAPEHRGKGLGGQLLKNGVAKFYETHSEPLVAFIKKTNLSSVKIFERNGFTRQKDGDVLSYIRECK